MAIALVGCRARPPRDEGPPPPRFAAFSAATALIGTWRWVHVIDEPTLRRSEHEEWSWIPAEEPRLLLRGRYLREVLVRSAAAPFACNQQRQYTQRALFELEVRELDGQLVIEETGYQAEPSPCDHGFRRLGSYRVDLRRGRADLTFAQGGQSLWQVDDAVPPLPEAPWAQETPSVAGAWRWSNDAIDEQGRLRHEEEQWDIADDPGDSGERLDAIYVRRVTIQSRDGAVIPCAGAASYGYEDRYILDGKRRGPVLAVRETAAAPGAHPCLRARATRVLDSATVERRGAFLVLEWRGKRRQVLHRP